MALSEEQQNRMKGKISGIGNQTTRNNEITASDTAIILNYIFGFDYNVMEGFEETHDNNIIELSKGICYAYGYVGYNDKTVFTYNKTSAPQYHFIYAEFDRSVVPNNFQIKTKNNQSGATIQLTTFRQDILSQIRTGVFQLPLYRVKTNETGIAEVLNLIDKKSYLAKAKRVVETSKITQEMGSVTGVTQNASDNSAKIATTEFVINAMKRERLIWE